MGMRVCSERERGCLCVREHALACFFMSVQCKQLVSLYLLSSVCFNYIHRYNLKKTRDHYSLFRFHCEYDLSLAVSSLPLNFAPKSSYTTISCSKLFQSVVLLVVLGGGERVQICRQQFLLNRLYNTVNCFLPGLSLCLLS